MGNKVSFTFLALDKYTRIAQSIADKTKGITKSMNALSKVARLPGQAIRGTAGLLKSGFAQITAAAAGFFGAKEFLQTGMRFQDALADLSAITGATGEDLAFLSDETMRLAKESRIAQEEVAGAFKLVASAKSELLSDPKALSEVTKQVLLLKNATGMELAGAANVALNALNQFGAGAEEANRFVNVLAAGSKIGASEVLETGEAILKSGVAANLAKVSFEETNALIQVLAKNGLKASEAGTGLQGVLLKLENTGMAQIQPSIVGVSAALKNLQDMQLGTQQMTKLFGLESIKAGGILINNADLVAQWAKELKGTTIAQQQADIRMRTFSSRMTGIGIAIKEKLIKAFIRLEPTLTRIAERFGAWVDSISTQDIDLFVGAVQTLASAMEFLFTVGSKVVGVFQDLGKMTAQLSLGEFSNAFDTFLKMQPWYEAAPPGIVAPALPAVPPSMMPPVTAPSQEARSRTDVNVNLRAPEGTVESIKRRTSGNAPGLNVGVNMATAGAM